MTESVLKTLGGFSDELASKAPTPGGGGASAAIGALGCALGQMVCNLTAGKKKYADVEPEILELLASLEEDRQALTKCIDEDAEAFGPLAKAYSIPKDDPTRDETMERVTIDAMEPPLKIMEILVGVIGKLDRLAKIGSKLALSDVGCAAIAAHAGLHGASLNVYINAASLKDREKAAEYEARVDKMADEAGKLALQVFEAVKAEVR